MSSSLLIANRGEIACRVIEAPEREVVSLPLAGRDQGWGAKLDTEFALGSSEGERAITAGPAAWTRDGCAPHPIPPREGEGAVLRLRQDWTCLSSLPARGREWPGDVGGIRSIPDLAVSSRVRSTSRQEMAGDEMSKELARRLRRNSSPPERAMWRILYAFRQEGYHFRRQVEIGAYYVDFACHRPALVIEVDGGTHTIEPRQSNDAVRDDYLAGRGYRVLRFWNNDVIGNPDGVYAMIAAALAEAPDGPSPPTLDPSPRGGGRRLPASKAT